MYYFFLNDFFIINTLLLHFIFCCLLEFVFFEFVFRHSYISLRAVDFFIVLGYSDANLFCSSTSIINRTVTPFCVISGMLN